MNSLPALYQLRRPFCNPLSELPSSSALSSEAPFSPSVHHKLSAPSILDPPSSLPAPPWTVNPPPRTSKSVTPPQAINQLHPPAPSLVALPLPWTSRPLSVTWPSSPLAPSGSSFPLPLPQSFPYLALVIHFTSAINPHGFASVSRTFSVTRFLWVFGSAWVSTSTSYSSVCPSPASAWPLHQEIKTPPWLLLLSTMNVKCCLNAEWRMT